MTLVEDLAQQAELLDGLATQHRERGNLSGVVECVFQAGVLREHRKRLMDALYHDQKQPPSLVREMLQYLNGGPLK